MGMSETPKNKAGGLADVVAGKTAISTVGKEGVGLTYRGYSIEDLAEKATFEEVAYLADVRASAQPAGIAGVPPAG